MAENEGTSIKGLVNGALIFGIVSILFEVVELIYIIGIPLGFTLKLQITIPWIFTIILWTGLGLSIVSDILISIARKRNSNPDVNDVKKIKIASVLSILFLVMMIAALILTFIFIGRIF